MLNTLINTPYISPSTSFFDSQMIKESKYNVLNKDLIINSLGATAWDEYYEQTFSHRWRGKDTLTWGNLDEWIFICWMNNLFQVNLGIEAIDFSKQSISWPILQSARFDKLGQIYIIKQNEVIKIFLDDNPLIISVLLEAKPVVEKFFGDNVEVRLEVVTDPEIPEYKQLFAYIKAENLSPEDALARLDSMDEAWFLKQIGITSGLLNFNLE